ncbi:MAG: WxcM-like domain-containing protein [Actinophytocola sp.]|nr:WxcM-like domain-containing protein [Actinophytocola sp.]
MFPSRRENPTGQNEPAAVIVDNRTANSGPVGWLSVTNVIPGGVGRVSPCRLVDLPEHSDPRGKLTVVQPGKGIDFEIRRAYYIHHIPQGAERGAHGHRRLRQVIVAVHGSFDVVVDDGFTQDKVTLDNPSRGLYVGPMVWRDMIDFAPGTVGLWLVSEPYDETEYYRDYETFLRDAKAMTGDLR